MIHHSVSSLPTFPSDRSDKNRFGGRSRVCAHGFNRFVLHRVIAFAAGGRIHKARDSGRMNEVSMWRR